MRKRCIAFKRQLISSKSVSNRSVVYIPCLRPVYKGRFCQIHEYAYMEIILGIIVDRKPEEKWTRPGPNSSKVR